MTTAKRQTTGTSKPTDNRKKLTDENRSNNGLPWWHRRSSSSCLDHGTAREPVSTSPLQTWRWDSWWLGCRCSIDVVSRTWLWYSAQDRRRGLEWCEKDSGWPGGQRPLSGFVTRSRCPWRENESRIICWYDLKLWWHDVQSEFFIYCSKSTDKAASESYGIKRHVYRIINHH